MKPFLTVLTLVLALGAMSKSPTKAPMPQACEVLLAIDITATLGAGSTVTPITSNESDEARMSLCSADTPDLSKRMTLMLREDLGMQMPDAARLRRQTMDELRGSIGAAVVFEELDIGAAGLWVGETGQLTVWHRAGRVMLIFSPTPMQDLAAAKDAARKVLAAFP